MFSGARDAPIRQEVPRLPRGMSGLEAWLGFPLLPSPCPTALSRARPTLCVLAPLRTGVGGMAMHPVRAWHCLKGPVGAVALLWPGNQVRALRADRLCPLSPLPETISPRFGEGLRSPSSLPHTLPLHEEWSRGGQGPAGGQPPRAQQAESQEPGLLGGVPTSTLVTAELWPMVTLWSLQQAPQLPKRSAVRQHLGSYLGFTKLRFGVSSDYSRVTIWCSGIKDDPGNRKNGNVCS